MSDAFGCGMEARSGHISVFLYFFAIFGCDFTHMLGPRVFRSLESFERTIRVSLL